MSEATGKAYATYRVECVIQYDAGGEKLRVPFIELIEGYSTFASIPKIVANLYGVSEDAVTIYSATLVGG